MVVAAQPVPPGLFAFQMLHTLATLATPIPVTASVMASPIAWKGTRRARMAFLQKCARIPLRTHSFRCRSVWNHGHAAPNPPF